MTSIDDIQDIRFEGLDLPELRDWITQIKQGQGSESMQSAVRALEQCVQVVVDLDDTLRRELGRLQINWEGNAGSLAAEVTRQQQAFLADAPDPLARSASGVAGQGESFESARHKLPNPDELRHHESENVIEWAAGGFGYESDYDAEAKKIDAQRKAAQAALAGYRDASMQHAGNYQPLPSMPAGNVQATPPAEGAAVPSAGIGPMPSDSEVSGAVIGGIVGAAPVIGSQPISGVDGGETAGSRVGSAPARGNAGEASAPETRPGNRVPTTGDEPRPGQFSQQPALPRDHEAPGKEVPRNPETPGTPLRPEQPQPPQPGHTPADQHLADPGGHSQASDNDGVGTGTMLGIAAGGAVLVGGGAYVAKRMLDKRAAAAAGSAAQPSSAGEEDNGKEGSVLSPATARRSGDGEHDSDLAAEDTLFDDERLVAPAVLGDNPEPATSSESSSGAEETDADPQAED